MAGTRYDVVIVGAGIAGLTAAMYCARQGLRTLVVSADLGGQLMLAVEVQNYPGFSSIRGFDLIRRVEEQARAYGAEIVYDDVVGVERLDDGFRVRGGGGEYECMAVILACGKAPRELGVPGEKRLKGRGVSYCAVCDAPLFRGRRVALVGWGYHAVESVNLLKDYAREVYWVFPGEKPYHDAGLVGDVLAKGNVKLVPSSEPVEIRGERRVEALVVRDKATGSLVELEVDGVFVEVGYETRVEFAKGLVELNERGEVVVDKACRTSTPGVFAAGDVTDVPYKQAVIAAGMGATAALSAYSYLMRLRGREVRVVSDWKHLKPREGGGLQLKL